MEFFHSPLEARDKCHEIRKEKQTIGYVQTMGALHDGHLSLVDRSVNENDFTVVSIFVNPLQFNRPEDLETYPVSMERDKMLLSEAGCDLAYSGTFSDFFPGMEMEDAMKIERPSKAILGLESAHRPGHLEGVQAIVQKLFEVVGSCQTYFGEKDFQQTLVVKELAERIGGIDVIVCQTIRESDGLAMSSRNARLNSAQRTKATKLYHALFAANQLWESGVRDPKTLEKIMRDEMVKEADLKLEYAAIRDPLNWTEETPKSRVNQAQALIAANLGTVRLIDNCRLGKLIG